MKIPEPKQYILDFEQLGLGLFVHWGLYSQLGRGEWVFMHENMNFEEYGKLKESFTAEDFDADDFVKTAKDAGFNYITLTTKHHEGFALYDACGLNDFDAPHSAAKRDIIKEFVDACNRHGIKPFFYHATLDWYQKEDFDNDFDKYLDYINNCVEILCKNYGKIGGFWFDGNWSKKNADWKVDKLYSIIRKYQPEAMIINNTGLFELGKIGHPEIDSVTFENGHATPMNREGMDKYIAAEMCHTINDHWGIGFNDINYKSPREIIESMCKCRKVGANYLMNIGPEAQGAINSYQKELLKLIGKWMGYFGEAIYNGRPYGAYSDGDSFILKSVDGKSLYIFAFNIGTSGSTNVVVGGKRSGAYSFGNLEDKISKVYWMDNNEQLDFSQMGDILCVDMKGQAYGTSFGVRVAKAEIEE